MALTYSACEWCGRLTAARDHDGDPACAPGDGCTRREQRSRPYGQRATVNGATLTVREWAKRVGVHETTLYREARGSSLATAIANRLGRRHA